MLLKVPEKIEQVLWEGTLGLTREIEQKRAEGRIELTDDDIKNLPIISIGQPEAWGITEYYHPEEIPYPIKTKLAETDFYIVRLACSFRSLRDEHRVQWARFLVRLLPDKNNRQPIAFDLYPLRVDKEVKHNVRFTLSPEIKFKEIVSIKSDRTSEIEYTELQPIISAHGVGQTTPCWDYYETKEIAIQGSKFMHLLVQAPKGIKTIKAVLSLFASVQIKGSVLAKLTMRDEKKITDQLTVSLVGR